MQKCLAYILLNILFTKCTQNVHKMVSLVFCYARNTEKRAKQQVFPCLALQKYIFAYILLNIFAVQKCSTKCLQMQFCIKCFFVQHTLQHGAESRIGAFCYAKLRAIAQRAHVLLEHFYGIRMYARIVLHFANKKHCHHSNT